MGEMNKSFRWNSEAEDWIDESLSNQFGENYDVTWDTDNAEDIEFGLTKKGFVYVIKCNKFYKIGMTKNYKQRINTLMVSNPYKIEPIVKVESNNINFLEKHLHNKFSDKKEKGEWFNLDPEDVAYMQRLDKGYFNIIKIS